MPSNLSDRRVSPLRARMIEDMTVRGFTEKTRQDYVRLPPCCWCSWKPPISSGVAVAGERPMKAAPIRIGPPTLRQTIARRALAAAAG
jgi:hypothetical protein